MGRSYQFRFRGRQWEVRLEGDQVTFGPAGEPPTETFAVFSGDTMWSAGGRRRWAAAPARDGVWVCVDGFTAFLEYADTDDGGGAAAGDEVRAPMTGTVVSVDVAAGDTVTAGQVLVVLTAMKMEYKLEAPRDGVVASLGCAAEEQVEMGQVLIALEPAGADAP